jgi:hypothetical protein
MSDLCYWFNGEIIKHREKKITDNTIQHLMGGNYQQHKYCFKEYAIVSMQSLTNTNFFVELCSGMELFGETLICGFYFPLYQYQAVPEEQIKKTLLEVKRWGLKTKSKNEINPRYTA